MDNTAQQIVEIYSYEGPENTVEDQIVAIDEAVRKRASARAVAVGILGCLLLGIGMSLTMTATGFFALGVVVGIVGLVAICAAYPLRRKMLASLRESEKPRIMELASRL